MMLLEYGLSKGLPISQMLNTSGITLKSLESLETSDPSLEQELVVINNLMSSLQENPFKLGFEVGLLCNINSLGLMGQALAARRSPKSLVEFASTYLQGDFHLTKISPRIYKSHVKTTFTARSGLSEREKYFALGRDFGGSVTFQESLLRELPVYVIEVGFQGQAVPGMQQVGDAYCCPVRFNQSSNYLITDIKVMEIVLPLGSRMFENIFSERVRTHVSALPNMSSFKTKTKAYLEQTGYRNISKERLSKAFNISPRTLTRYLANEGTNFRELSIHLRMEKAQELLINTKLTVENVAMEVGFSSGSAFSSAFSKYVGRGPLEFRLVNSLGHCTVDS